jgi:hypothetical protein
MTIQLLILFMEKNRANFAFALFLFLLAGTNYGYSSNGIAPKIKPVPPIIAGTGGRMEYTTDSQGDRVPDFSYCGYKASEQSIPDVPVKIVVSAIAGDATLRIQSALDYVATLPLDKDGFRGAVLLGKGLHFLEGHLKINASGVILRGSGTGKDG